MKRLSWSILLAVTMAVGVACGGGGDDDTGSTGDGANGGASTPGEGSTSSAKTTATSKPETSDSSKGCDLKITGDKEISARASYTPSGSGAGTDYWFSDDDLRSALLALVKAGDSGISEADAKKKVDEDMKNDPRLFLLIINCVIPQPNEASISFFPADDSKYADVPFTAGKYTIAAGGIGLAKPGAFAVLMNVGDKFFAATEPGELNITKFDTSGIAGAFKFKAAEPELLADGTPLKVTVEGTFDYPCFGGSRCKK